MTALPARVPAPRVPAPRVPAPRRPLSQRPRIPSTRRARVPLPRRFAASVRRAAARPDAGMTTAEYAVGTVAACGFAAVLYKVVTSDTVSAALAKLVQRALDAAF